MRYAVGTEMYFISMCLHCKTRNKHCERRCPVLKQIIIIRLIKAVVLEDPAPAGPIAPGLFSELFQNFKRSSAEKTACPYAQTGDKGVR